MLLRNLRHLLRWFFSYLRSKRFWSCFNAFCSALFCMAVFMLITFNFSYFRNILVVFYPSFYFFLPPGGSAREECMFLFLLFPF